MSLYVTVFAGSAPVGGLVAGFLAEQWGAATALSVGAALAIGVLLLVAWRLHGVGMPRIGATPVVASREPRPASEVGDAAA
jgi:hypothetical protein